MDLVPASHGSVKPAWFEFILSPATLKSHLEKPDCDPTATDLITQFFANLPNLSDIPSDGLNGSALNNTPGLPSSPIKQKVAHCPPDITSNGVSCPPLPPTTPPVPPLVPPRTIDSNLNNTPKTQSQQMSNVVINNNNKSSTPSNGNTNVSNGQTTGVTNNHNNSPPSVLNANGQQTAPAAPWSQPQSADNCQGYDAIAVAEDAKYRAKKAHALKTLALKTASYLNWNIELFENDLSVSTQIALMSELKHVCNQSGTPEEYKLFANILYTRWFVRSSISHRLSKIQPENSNSYNTQIIAPPNMGTVHEIPTNSPQDLNKLFNRDTSSIDEIMKILEALDNGGPDIENDILIQDAKPKRLKLDLTYNYQIKRPTIDCFDFRSSNNWDHGTVLDNREFLDSVLYDLGKYFFFGEMYKEARDVLKRIHSDNMVKTMYPHLTSYLQSSIAILDLSKSQELEDIYCDSHDDESVKHEEKIEAYLTKKQSHVAKPKSISDVEEGEISDMDEGTNEDHITDIEEDLDIRLTKHSANANAIGILPTPMAHLTSIPMMSQLTTMPSSNQITQQDPLAILATQDRDERFIHVSATQVPMQVMSIDPQSEISKPPDDCIRLTIEGDMYMSKGEYTRAMGNFVEVLTIMTEYFTHFSQNNLEDDIVNRMIQCSIKLSCYTQAVVLYQMTHNLNYGIAFKQLNERFCNDCCDDLYECMWDITLLEYIIHIHTKRGELERKCRLIQLIGQLELNENNSEEILLEAMQSRRAKFYRIMAKKYL